MPKITSPQQRQTECLRHLKLAAQAVIDAVEAVEAGASTAEVAKVIEAAGCYVRRSDGKLPTGAIPAPAAEQRVTIVGPNLPSSLERLGTFHVHAEGCADLKRRAIREHAAEGWTISAATQTEVGDHIYEDHIAEGSMSPGDGFSDCHFAPCVTIPV